MNLEKKNTLETENETQPLLSRLRTTSVIYQPPDRGVYKQRTPTVPGMTVSLWVYKYT